MSDIKCEAKFVDLRFEYIEQNGKWLLTNDSSIELQFDHELRQIVNAFSKHREIETMMITILFTKLNDKKEVESIRVALLNNDNLEECSFHKELSTFSKLTKDFIIDKVNNEE